jgi:hypothetical protein
MPQELLDDRRIIDSSELHSRSLAGLLCSEPAILSAMATQVGEDGVLSDPNSIRAEEIRAREQYAGEIRHIPSLSKGRNGGC